MVMRRTYVIEVVVFPPARMQTRVQRAKKIVVHRQGNPGVEGQNGMKWGASSGAFSIQRYIDDGTCFVGIPTDRHAFHVLESRYTGQFGLPNTGEYGRRGDYDTIGIECEDESPASADLAPGQEYGLSRETRITLVLVLAALLREHPWLTPADIIFHSDLDPHTRPHDPGDALNRADLRADVADLLAGREPWRVVGRWATGKPATKPTSTAPTSTAPTGPVETGDLNMAGNAYIVIRGDTLSSIAAKTGIALSTLVTINGITNPNAIEVGQVLRLFGAVPQPLTGATEADVARARAEGRTAGLSEARKALSTLT